MGSIETRSNWGRNLLLIGTIIFIHSAYSIYEARSVLRSTGEHFDFSKSDITVEVLVSFIILLVGVCSTASPLKEISWESEMRQRTIDQMDSCMGFADFRHRGQLLFASTNSESWNWWKWKRLVSGLAEGSSMIPIRCDLNSIVQVYNYNACHVKKDTNNLVSLDLFHLPLHQPSPMISRYSTKSILDFGFNQPQIDGHRSTIP